MKVKCSIQTGVPSNAQESEHRNGTRMLTGGGGFAYTIATHVFVPREVEAEGETAIANWIRQRIESGDADHHIIVGPNNEIDC